MNVINSRPEQWRKKGYRREKNNQRKGKREHNRNTKGERDGERVEEDVQYLEIILKRI